MYEIRSGEPLLRVGERVILPSNMVQSREFVGRVLRIMESADTDLPLKEVVRREEQP